MNQRDREQALLDRCKEVTKGHVKVARTQVEASLFHLAAMTLESQYPGFASRLWQAGDAWFQPHQKRALPLNKLIEDGQLVNLPRLHDMLVKQLEHA